MRSKLRSVLLALVVVCAFGVTAVASASAHEFVASKTGALTKTVTSAVITLTEGVEMSCTKATQSGTVKALKSKTQVVGVAYSECELLPSGIGVSPFSAEYEVSAEGKAVLLKEFITTIPGAGCSIKWLPSAKETSTDAFKNSAPVKTVSATRASGTMKHEGTGGPCGPAGEQSEGSTMKETASYGVEGGTLQWK